MRITADQTKTGRKISLMRVPRQESGLGTFRRRSDRLSMMFPSVLGVVRKGKYELFGSITSAADRKCFA